VPKHCADLVENFSPLRCSTIFPVGQYQMPRHVRDDGSFPRKQPCPASAGQRSGVLLTGGRRLPCCRGSREDGRGRLDCQGERRDHRGRGLGSRTVIPDPNLPITGHFSASDSPVCECAERSLRPGTRASCAARAEDIERAEVGWGAPARAVQSSVRRVVRPRGMAARPEDADKPWSASNSAAYQVSTLRRLSPTM
jgi:hypothetical protein